MVLFVAMPVVGVSAAVSGPRVTQLTPVPVSPVDAAHPMWQMSVTATLSDVRCPATVLLAAHGNTVGPLQLCAAGTRAGTKVAKSLPLMFKVYDLRLLPDAMEQVRTTVTSQGQVASPADVSLTTPKAPVWVAVGDSYSSGHHQLMDEAGLPPIFGCEASDPLVDGECDTYQNDHDYAWLSRAVIEINKQLPSGADRWRLTPVNLAKSGAPVAEYGNFRYDGTLTDEPRTAAWRSSGQAAGLGVALRDHAGSWNVVSITGGANDARFADVLKEYYKRSFEVLGGVEPWAVFDRSACPRLEPLFANLQERKSRIMDALTSLADIARTASTGVRILDVRYPYVEDRRPASGQGCFGNPNPVRPSGSGGAVALLNDLHRKAFAGTAGVKTLDLVANFGEAPITTAPATGCDPAGPDPSSYIQLRRFYGYPHPNGIGQGRIAQAAAELLGFTITPDYCERLARLEVATSGEGTGTVNSEPSGISCPLACISKFRQDSVVTLTATPDLGSTFSGWTGDCEGFSTCQVPLDTNKVVGAVFGSVAEPAGKAWITAGQSHTCVLRVDGAVRCWGDNTYGQLGDGTTTSSATPVPVTGLVGAIAISAGFFHTCALLDDGTVQCWGYNGAGQLGDETFETRSTLVSVVGIDSAVGLAAGGLHTCALGRNGTAACWGDNSVGQLGDATTTGRAAPRVVVGLSNAVTITAGGYHSCSLIGDGTARCWGHNSSGELGNDTVEDSPVPVVVTGMTGAVAIEASDYEHTCAVLGGGTVRCWGWGFYGQLGQLDDLTDAVAITGGYIHTCGLRTGGAVQCWGNNWFGQIGSSYLNDRNPSPVQVEGLFGVVAITSGQYHSCALREDLTVLCWGDNASGQLGDGSPGSSATPVPVGGLTDSTAITARWAHFCALLDDRGVQCWGDNSNGQLGEGQPGTATVPVRVVGVNDALAVSVGQAHTCTLLADGAVRCWGDNGFGQLGDGTTTDKALPVAVSGVSDAISIAAGEQHTCAVVGDGTVRCWGQTIYGQLGGSGSQPVIVTDLGEVAAIAAGSAHTCALLNDGTVRCWGFNGDGQLGDGTRTNSIVPVAVAGLSGATAISAGNGHSCALVDGGTVRCWGSNYYGQLGGTDTQPVVVTGISTAVSVTAGYFHTCALLADTTVRCWGNNQYAQLGDGTMTTRATPVPVIDLGGVSAVAASMVNTCALLVDRTARCWGSNVYGQFGDGHQPANPIPRVVVGLS